MRSQRDPSRKLARKHPDRAAQRAMQRLTPYHIATRFTLAHPRGERYIATRFNPAHPSSESSRPTSPRIVNYLERCPPVILRWILLAPRHTLLGRVDTPRLDHSVIVLRVRGVDSTAIVLERRWR